MPGHPFYRSSDWAKVRAIVIRRDGNTCQRCGKDGLQGGDLHVDHILPRSTHPDLALDPNNCRVTCRKCNLDKGDRTVMRPHFINHNWVTLG